jgi:hypothetical protein
MNSYRKLAYHAPIIRELDLYAKLHDFCKSRSLSIPHVFFDHIAKTIIINLKVEFLYSVDMIHLII